MPACRNGRARPGVPHIRCPRSRWRPILILPDDEGLWAQRCDTAVPAGRPALFLDRDGVIVEEVDFLARAQDVKLSVGVGRAIAAVNAAGLPVVVVTNQSGIARGLFGWAEFEAVQREIAAQLARHGARLDAVLACAHHELGSPPFDRAGHPWRKPGPGMLAEANAMLGMDMARSWIVGDRLTDLGAGFNAGLAGGWLALTGYGERDSRSFDAERERWASRGFRAEIVANASEAIERFLVSAES